MSPHRRSDPCTDLVNLVDAVIGEAVEGKVEMSARVAVALTDIRGKLAAIQRELIELKKKKRR